jgi:hypothetical protein
LPAAALTVRADVAGPLTVYNTEPGTTGLTIQAGGDIAADAVPVTIPGTPSELSLINSDPALSGMRDVRGRLPTDADFDPASRNGRLFASVFGIWPETYRDQPAAVAVDCSAGGCAAAVRDAAAMNPGRVLWVTGDLDVDTAGDVGSADQPLAIVVSGNVNLAAGVRLFGLVYARGSAWAGEGEIRGAAWAEDALTAAGGLSIVYDATILNALRQRQGSFVRVPGSWRDLP